MTAIRHGKGLTELPKDRRDWSYHKNFGVAPLTGLPDQYLLLSTILDQNGWNECTAYMKSGIDESEYGVIFSPAWNYAKEGAEDPPPNPNGYSMRDPFQVGCDYGALPLATPGVLSEAVNGFDITLNPANWPAALDLDAQPYAHPGYASVKGPYDNFDSMRSAMWNEASKKRAIGFGVMWYNEWTDAESGIIPETYSSKDGLHAVKMAGWSTTKRDGTFINPATKALYQVWQNTFNTSVGDGGLFYASRAIVNRELDPVSLGIYIHTDQPLQNPKTVSALQNLLNALIALIHAIQNRSSNGMGAQMGSVPSMTLAQAKTWAAGLCAQVGLDAANTQILIACIMVESGFNRSAINLNRDATGAVTSIDYGIIQVNDFFHIAPDKDFPSPEYVLSNPDACVKWMAQMFKEGKQNLWSSFVSGAYKQYLNS